MPLLAPLVAAAVAVVLALPALAAERANAPVPTPRARAQPAQQAPRAACASPDGPQPDGTIRCEMCPAAPGSRVLYRPMACTNGKWTEAGPCGDGDCAGRTY
ncbi:MAG TPA: hypothetical protein VLR71_04125 [Casimicrobiaceae bacterium]|nr:hypothetical protein [Casimicrobiaceae bacterium]